MAFRRTAARIATVVLLFLAAPSCVGVLGIDDQQKDVVHELCKCAPFNTDLCQTVVSERLRSASAGTREAWMRNYLNTCNGNCAKFSDCYKVDPACTQTGDSCLLKSCVDCCTDTGVDKTECQ